ncbi:hypothetical protein K438DRAFT_2171779 [Mycena galopus ATCC 62051]|nr:hypothetical protein K438DRAFT_2171779 [Mycena galopus ATCC 62051]
METFAIASFLVPHCMRWDYVKLSLSSPFSFQTQMSRFSHIDLTLLHARARIHRVMGHDAPLLRTAIIRAGHNEGPLANVILPWAQLTSLTLHNAYTREIMQLLQQTPNLLHYVLGPSFSSEDSQYAGPDVVLPRLELMTMVTPMDNGEMIVGLNTSNFVLPALRSLRTPDVFMNPVANLRSLTPLISHSGCKLQEVHLNKSSLQHADTYHGAFQSTKFYFELDYGD